MRAYVPERGDVVWIDMDPQAGHEQAGRRPAVVLSPRFYNSASKLALFCPITSQVKGYPFEVMIPEGAGVIGVVLADEVKNLDWHARKARFICRLPDPCVKQVIVTASRLLS
jgi:mRNA interferase MazF